MKKDEYPNYTKYASLSDDKRHRFLLTRKWKTQKEERYILGLYGEVLWILLNPSNANDTIDDPTIKKIVTFTDRMGFTSLSVVNLYSYISSSPAVLWNEQTREERKDLNFAYIKAAADKATRIMFTWGDYQVAHTMGAKITAMLLANGNRIFYCLGKNVNGSPKHPVRLSYSTQVEVYYKRSVVDESTI